MQPHIEALRRDLQRVLVDARDERLQLLTVCASHDLALPLLQHHAADAAALYMDLRFQSSVESLRALNEGTCLVAGFHVPVVLGAAPTFSKSLKPLLKPGRHKHHRMLSEAAGPHGCGASMRIGCAPSRTCRARRCAS